MSTTWTDSRSDEDRQAEQEVDDVEVVAILAAYYLNNPDALEEEDPPDGPEASTL